MRALVIATIAIVAATAHANEREEQFRAALRAWQPNLFGSGSVSRGPLSVAAVEREGMDAVRGCGHCPQVPFGYMHSYWEKFKRQIQPGDSLVFFRSDKKSWSGLYGREGYAIIRNGKVVKVMIGVLS